MENQYLGLGALESFLTPDWACLFLDCQEERYAESFLPPLSDSLKRPSEPKERDIEMVGEQGSLVPTSPERRLQHGPRSHFCLFKSLSASLARGLPLPTRSFLSWYCASLQLPPLRVSGLGSGAEALGKEEEVPEAGSPLSQWQSPGKPAAPRAPGPPSVLLACGSPAL